MIWIIIIGFVLIVVGFVCFYEADNIVESIFCIIMVIGGVILLFFALATITEKREKPVEYPASEYTLELKITEYQGQKDTTYVLIPKETIE